MAEIAPQGSSEPLASPAKFKKYAMIAAPVLLAVGAYAFWQGSQVECSSSGAQSLVIDIAKQKSWMLNLLGGTYLASGKDSRLKDSRLKEHQSLMAKKQQLADKHQQARNFCQAGSQHPSNFAEVWQNRETICDPEDANGPDLNSLLETCDSYCADQEGGAEIVNARNAAYQYYYDYAKVNVYPLIAQIAQVDTEIKASEQAKEQTKKDVWREVSQDVKWTLDDIITHNKQEDTGSVACKAVVRASLDEFYQQRNIKYTIEKDSSGELHATVWGL